MTPVIKHSLRTRKIFTPNMLNTWKLTCKVCGKRIDDERNHLEKHCSGIHDSQVRMTHKNEKGAKRRRSILLQRPAVVAVTAARFGDKNQRNSMFFGDKKSSE